MSLLTLHFHLTILLDFCIWYTKILVFSATDWFKLGWLLEGTMLGTMLYTTSKNHYAIILTLGLECCCNFVAGDTLVVKLMITQWLLRQRQKISGPHALTLSNQTRYQNKPLITLYSYCCLFSCVCQSNHCVISFTTSVSTATKL